MLFTLAFRHLLVRPVRALVLLAGFALGVGVMLVLLSIGQAMLAQSRDVALVGGGEVTLLPEGIDVEALRTGGVGGLFFGIDRARFVTRQFVLGPRFGGLVRAASPVLEEKLLYLSTADTTIAVRAGGEVPSAARAVGSGLDVVAGRWDDAPAAARWLRPSARQLYDELDRFHLPARPDSTWAEWQYFNVLVAPDEWWYITLLVGGEVPDGRWGGQVLVTRRLPGGRHAQHSVLVEPSRIAFDTAGAGLAVGPGAIRQSDGVYQLDLALPDGVRADLVITPSPGRYFPPVELAGDGLVSGYVVPILRGAASGRVCAEGRCRIVEGVPAYHDHNWGTWRDVTWEWGMGRGSALDVLYGGVRQGGRAAGGAPFFLAVADSAGVRQVLRFSAPAFDWEGPAVGRAPRSPRAFQVVAGRGSDSLVLAVRVESAHATTDSVGRHFLQMRGAFTIEGRLGGRAVADSGRGFFETWLEPDNPEGG